MRFVPAWLIVLSAAACTGPAATTTSTAPTTIVSTTSTTVPGALPILTATGIPFTSNLLLDVLSPQEEGEWPVLVVVHGGSWFGGERSDISDFAAYTAGRGAVVYNPGYRTLLFGGGYPQTFEDVACAVRFARSTAARYGGDPGRLVLIGYSAGGHLAAVVALAGDNFQGDCLAGGSALPDGFVGASAPYDSDQFSPLLIPFFGGSQADVPEAWEAGNPFSYVDDRLDLPIHLFQGSADDLVNPALAEQFYQSLADAGHQVQLETLEGASHRDLVEPAVFARLVVDAALSMVTSPESP